MSEDTGNTDKNARYVNMLHWILIMKSTVPVYYYVVCSICTSWYTQCSVLRIITNFLLNWLYSPKKKNWKTINNRKKIVNYRYRYHFKFFLQLFNETIL